MKLRTFKKLELGIYRVSILTEDWSQADLRAMEKLGEPEIDLGGTFTDSLSFTLDSNLRKIMSESPFNMAIDNRDYADAEDRANLWTATIIDRIEAAVLQLRQNSDTFTGESVQEI